MDLNKLKVPELRKELQSRGLDSKGNKPVLIERLRMAMENENAAENEEESENEEQEKRLESSEENSLLYTTAESEAIAQHQESASEEESLSAPAVDIPDMSVTKMSDPCKTDIVTAEELPTEPTINEIEVDKLSGQTQEEIVEDASVDGRESTQVMYDSDSLQETTLDLQEGDQKNDESYQQETEDYQYETPNQDQSTIDLGLSDHDQSVDYSSCQQPPELIKSIPLETTELQTENVTTDKLYVTENESIVKPSQDASMENLSQSSIQSDVELEMGTGGIDAVSEEKGTDQNQTKREEMDAALDDNIADQENITSSDVNVEQSVADYSQLTKDTTNEDVGDISSEEAMEIQECKDILPEEAMETQENNKIQLQEAMEAEESVEGQETVESQDNVEAQDTVEPIVEEPKKRVRKSRFDQPEERNDRCDQQDERNNRIEEDRKRKHSPSPDHSSWGHYEAPPKIIRQDDEPNFDDDAVILSWYDSDLNLNINKENFLKAVPIYEHGFMYMWAGARGTYGFSAGKIYYDVKLLEKMPVSVSDEFEIYSFRLGWSAPFTNLQLGEASLSYGYDSSGKKCVDNNFEDYGQPFNAEDVIGCLVDFESDEQNVQILYTFNGVKQDVAFLVPKEQLEGKALYPHVMSKNISFEVNFGERAEPWALEERFEGDFEWASKVPLEKRVKGPQKPENKKQCEMMMICGLPCSGKTIWIRNHVQNFPQKLYHVLSIDDVVAKMKILNEPIQTYFQDSMDSLVERCTRCVNRLLDLASVRWRNYILDQGTNIFPTVQRKKMRNFESFTRLAVVILPSEEEYTKLLEKWDENPLRDSTVSLLELKGNFRLPEEGELFDNVLLVGVTREEAEELIKKYNREGREARQRDDRTFNRNYGRDMERGYGRPMGGFRNRWMDRGHPPSMGRGGWGPRGGMDRMPPGGGFRDRRNWRDSCNQCKLISHVGRIRRILGELNSPYER